MAHGFALGFTYLIRAREIHASWSNWFVRAKCVDVGHAAAQCIRTEIGPIGHPAKLGNVDYKFVQPRSKHD